MSDPESLIDLVVAAVRARADAPVDGREALSCKAFLDAVAQLARPFDEHAHPTHVTASAVVTGERGVVLLKHKRLGIWLQPGGHIDADEDPMDTAVREAKEETGLDVQLVSPAVIHVDVHPGPRGHTHLDLRYHCRATGDPAPPPGESQHVAWFDWPEAVATADPGLSGLLRALTTSPPSVGA